MRPGGAGPGGAPCPSCARPAQPACGANEGLHMRSPAHHKPRAHSHIAGRPAVQPRRVRTPQLAATNLYLAPRKCAASRRQSPVAHCVRRPDGPHSRAAAAAAKQGSASGAPHYAWTWSTGTPSKSTCIERPAPLKRCLLVPAATLRRAKHAQHMRHDGRCSTPDGVSDPNTAVFRARYIEAVHQHAA